MNNDEDDFIIGAKKKNEKNHDKNEIEICIEGFKKHFLTKFEKSDLVNMCMTGEINKSNIRPTIWKIFLNLLPYESSLEDWVNRTIKNRAEYKNKIKGLTALKKFSGDPLGGSNDSSWNSFFEDNELKKIINLDVNRTYQDKELFQNTVIKDMMVNILFLWSKENRDISYKQGMNEILAVILFGFHPFYYKTEKIDINNLISNKQNNAKEIYLFLHDENELAADLYHVFNAIMNKGIKELFDTRDAKKKDTVTYKKYELFQQQWTDEETELEKDQLPLQRRCYLIVREKLKAVDESLFNHFIKIDLNCTIFLQRWLKCIFNREFHPRDVIVLWDAVIANDILDESKGIYSFSFIDFIAVAMMNYIKEDLIRKDQNDCFMRLFKYPPIETPVILIKLALQFKDMINKKIKKKEKIKIEKPIVNEPLTIVENTIGGNTNMNKIINKKEENIIINEVTHTQTKENDEKYQIVNRLEELYLKYKNIFDPEDSIDFETIIETLKSNLAE